jgi:segregation and condensation protein B
MTHPTGADDAENSDGEPVTGAALRVIIDRVPQLASGAAAMCPFPDCRLADEHPGAHSLGAMSSSDDVDPGDGAAPWARGDSGATEALPPLPELTEAALEALLFVAERPLTRREIASLSGAERATVDARLGDLEVSLANRGIRLLVSGERVELATSPEAGQLIARYVGAETAPRLSAAALETLAIVAYGQPITKAAIERIRGVDSDYTIRALLHRRLVSELGRSDAPGRPFLYGTAFEFLERFGMTSLDQLPPLEAEVAARLADAPAPDERVGEPTPDAPASPVRSA